MPTNANDHRLQRPRVLIAGLRGSGGKSLVAVGVAAAWHNRGWAVAPFKKGADYIDAAWLSAATERPCRNLDLFMVKEEIVRRSFVEASTADDLSVIEGNRGLYDGMDPVGTYSSAEVAKLIRSPIVLVCDCTKTTRTLAAMIMGCQQFDPQVEIRGIVLNRVAGRRHEALLREVVDQYCALPVVGAIPRFSESPFPERHLGLVPPQEHTQVPEAIARAARIAEVHLDLDAIRDIAVAADSLSVDPATKPERAPVSGTPRVRIGVLRDEAFQFYYPENLEAIAAAGGEIVEASPLRDTTLPTVDAIYIGGGFPETLADRLAENASFRKAVAEAVNAGVPVYAECAGAVYLGKSLVMDDNTYPMSGALPVVFGFGPRPQGHGYSVMDVAAENPFFPIGESFNGHEFHYSRVLDMDEDEITLVFRVRRGYGVDGERDGICRKNTLATYCHLHALGVEGWAPALVRAGAARMGTTH